MDTTDIPYVMCKSCNETSNFAEYSDKGVYNLYCNSCGVFLQEETILTILSLICDIKSIRNNVRKAIENTPIFVKPMRKPLFKGPNRVKWP